MLMKSRGKTIPIRRGPGRLWVSGIAFPRLLRLHFPMPANGGKGFPPLPISPRADNGGDDSGWKAGDPNCPKPILSRKMHDRNARNNQACCGTQIRKEGSLVCQESSINRKFVPQDQIAAVESRIGGLFHVSL